jgi:hypothetical protein
VSPAALPLLSGSSRQECRRPAHTPCLFLQPEWHRRP